jgi:hypothetical protein
MQFCILARPRLPPKIGSQLYGDVRGKTTNFTVNVRLSFNALQSAIPTHDAPFAQRAKSLATKTIFELIVAKIRFHWSSAIGAALWHNVILWG